MFIGYYHGDFNNFIMSDFETRHLCARQYVTNGCRGREKTSQSIHTRRGSEGGAVVLVMATDKGVQERKAVDISERIGVDELSCEQYLTLPCRSLGLRANLQNQCRSWRKLEMQGNLQYLS